MLCLEDQLLDNDEKLLDEAHEELILVQKIWKGVQNQLSDELVPQFFELRRQSECARCVVVS